MDAAESWSSELTTYIAPIHEDQGQTQEAANYRDRADDINEAIFVLMEEQKRDA